MNKVKNLIPAFIILLFGILLLFFLIPNYISVLENSSVINARFFPYIIASLIIIFSLTDIITSFRELKNNDVDENTEKKFPNFVRVLLVLLSCIGWVIVIPYLGYIVTTLIITVLLMLIFGNKSVLQIGITSILFTALSYIIFVNLLNVSFPRGIIF